MRTLKTLPLEKILPLFKKHLGVSVSRTTVYTYIKTRNFPASIGIGRPRQWREDLVNAWFEKQMEKSDPPKERKKK